MAVSGPQVTAPLEGDQFNLGIVTIGWDVGGDPYVDPYTDVSYITYNVEYTDNYIGRETNWFTLKRRISSFDVSYEWNVGKMIKSSTVRVRMRAHNVQDETYSDWSMSETFAINVFELIAPAIVNPISGTLYTDFILIVLDETLTRNTYHQKIRYTLEYSSSKRSVDWAVIAANLPVGQNVIRWNLEDVASSDDYVLKLTARNASTSCQETAAAEPDQIAYRFIYDLNIQQSGMFFIDTMPPQGILEIENMVGVSNQREQIVNVFAEDATTEVQEVQLRECDAGSILSLGDLEDPYDPLGGCTSIQDLLPTLNDFGKRIPLNTKTKWVFDDKSGLKKLEALLTDVGGNTSIQEPSKVFLSSFNSDELISDFIIVLEQRDKVTIDETTTPPSVVIDPSVFEVVYLGTITGEFWVLEPFPRLMYSMSTGLQISKVFEFNDLVLIFTYNLINRIGAVYRNDIVEATLLYTFTDLDSQVNGLAIFNDILFIGLENGELWQYNGISFTSLTIPTMDAISTLHGDKVYLYIGFENSPNMLLYDGNNFTTLIIES